MGFLSRLFGGSKKKGSITLNEEELVEAGACPSCWDMQEYEDQYQSYSFDATKANINHDKLHQKAFVQQFVETHVTGIRLKRDGDKLSCPSCKGKYKHVSSKAN